MQRDKTTMEPDVMGRLLKLQDLDRKRDRLQRKLDEVPVKLGAQREAVEAADGALSEHRSLLQVLRTETQRTELEMAEKESARDKVKTMMNAPKLTAKEYSVLQEQLAGVLADISSLTDRAVAAMERIEEAEKRLTELQGELEAAQGRHDQEKEKLEGSLSGVRGELEELNTRRKDLASPIPADILSSYERVRRKHKQALSAIAGTLDRVAGRIGNDLHCSNCYMSIPANDALEVLAGKKLLSCKSCGRLLYVP